METVPFILLQNMMDLILLLSKQLKFLINFGKSFQFKFKNNNTLYYARRYNEIMMSALTDEKDRDPLILCNNRNQTALHVAMECDQAERAIILLKFKQNKGFNFLV